MSFSFNRSHSVDLLLMMSKDHIENTNGNIPLADRADNFLRMNYGSELFRKSRDTLECGSIKS